MVEAVVRPAGLYRLRLSARRELWRGALPGSAHAEAWQRRDGAVVVRAPDDHGLDRARFMLALDDDTTEFHRRFARDPLLGPSARALVGWRPVRLATVAHATVRAVCGQLIESRRARTIERAVIRACGGGEVVTQGALRGLSPARLCACDLSAARAAALTRLSRTLDLERLRERATPAVAARLLRERGIGPWSVGVIALEGLGRYDAGLVGDLGLIKLVSALRGRRAEAWETAELLAPYAEWQGLAGELFLLGWSRGLVPGAHPDIARSTRLRSRKAA